MNSLIEQLNQWGGDLISIAWPMFWQSSLLIALLLAGDRLLRRRLRASLRYALWLVVLLKLCLPPTFALPTSPAWWLHATPPTVVEKPSVPPTTVTYREDAQFMLPAGTELPVFTPPPARLTIAAWLLVLAVVTSVGLLLWMLVRWWQVTRLVRRAHASEWLTTLADDARLTLRMRSHVPVKLTAQAMSPAVCGLFRPAILMPESLAASLSEPQLRAVLLHELIHLRRGDVWVNFIQTLLQIVYWWHPLVWLANARLRRVREEAVDDAVMLALRGEAETYAPTLLAVAKLALNRPLATLGLVGIMESRSVLRQRIERLLDFHPPRQAGLTLVSLLGVLAFTAVAVPMGQGPAKEAVQSAPVVSKSLVTWPLTNQPVLIAAAIYQMGEAELAATVKGLKLNLADASGEPSWVASPEEYRLLSTNLASSGMQPLTRPRIQTGSGKPAQMFVGDATNGIEFDCTPLIVGDRIDVTVAGKVIEKTIEASTNSFSARTAVENDGGLVICANNPEGAVKTKVVVVMRVQILTNTAGIRRIGNLPPAATVVPTTVTGIMTDTNFRIALRALEERSSTQSLDEPEVRQSQLRAVNTFVNALPVKMEAGQLTQGGKKLFEGSERRQQNIQKLRNIRLERVAFDKVPLGEVLRALSEESRKHDPDGGGLNFMINPDQGQNNNPKVDPITGLPVATNAPTVAELPLLPMTVTLRTNVLLGDVLDALVLAAPQPIRYSIQDFAVVFSAGGPQSQLFTRVYYLDASAFISQMRKIKGVGEDLGEATNATAVSLAARKYVSRLGVNLESPVGKAVFFNDKTGGLLIKATEADQEVIERALAMLNVGRSASGNAVKTAGSMVQAGKIHYEMGNLGEAEMVFKQALVLEPGNAAAKYYLGLIEASRRARLEPKTNSAAPGRKQIVAKLSEVQLDRFGPYDGLPLDQVLQQVNAAIRTGDGGGIRLTMAASARAVNIHLPAAVEPSSLLNALAALVGSASQPIKFSLQEDGIVFSLKEAPDPASLSTRIYKVDTKPFLANLKETGRTLNPTNNSPQAIAEATAKLLAGLGVDIDPATGQTVLFNNRTGMLIVHAMEADLDKIEQVVQALNQIPPQIHLKALFYEVPEKALGLMGHVPGLTNGLTAVLTPAAAAKLIKAIQSIRGTQVLGAPEVTTRRGRQCLMETVEVITVVTNLAYREVPTDAVSTNNLTHGEMQAANVGVLTPQVVNLECGPVLEVLPRWSQTEEAIQLSARASVTKFFGYAGPHRNFFGFADPPTNAVVTSAGGKMTLPEILPVTQYNQGAAELALADGETLVMFPQSNREPDPRRQQLIVQTEKKKGKKTLVVLVTASVVDQAGNRLHPDQDRLIADRSVR